MKRRSRRILKWTGLAGCVTLVVVAVLGEIRGVTYVGTGYFLATSTGVLRVGWGDAYSSPEVKYDPVWVQPFRFWRPTSVAIGENRIVVIPIWCMLVLLAIPTFLLWRADRRRPAGHCQSCDYDLTGNRSGICPECGAVV